MNASERHALARIAAKRPDTNFTYTAAELHAFITAVREEALDTTRCSDAEPASPTAPSVETGARGPETQRLIDRLVAKGTKNFSVSWGPDAEKLTAEQRAAEINRAMDAVEAGDYEEITDLDEERHAPQPERMSPGSAPNTDAPRQNTADPEGSV